MLECPLHWLMIPSRLPVPWDQSDNWCLSEPTIQIRFVSRLFQTMIGTDNGHIQLKIITGSRRSVSAMPFASTWIVTQTLLQDPPVLSNPRYIHFHPYPDPAGNDFALSRAELIWLILQTLRIITNESTKRPPSTPSQDLTMPKADRGIFEKDNIMTFEEFGGVLKRESNEYGWFIFNIASKRGGLRITSLERFTIFAFLTVCLPPGPDA